MKPKVAIILLTLAALSPCVNASEAVFTNGLEVARHNTSVAIAFPDVSHTPRHDQILVPIPYPILGRAGDSHRIRSAERGIVLRDPRYSQERDEEACDTPPIGGQHSGRAYFERYSFDVKIGQRAK